MQGRGPLPVAPEIAAGVKQRDAGRPNLLPLRALNEVGVQQVVPQSLTTVRWLPEMMARRISGPKPYCHSAANPRIWLRVRSRAHGRRESMEFDFLPFAPLGRVQPLHEPGAGCTVRWFRNRLCIEQIATATNEQNFWGS